MSGPDSEPKKTYDELVREFELLQKKSEDLKNKFHDVQKELEAIRPRKRRKNNGEGNL